MRLPRLRARRATFLLSLAALAACGDDGPLSGGRGPGGVDDPATTLAAVECRASVADGDLSCRPVQPASGGPQRVILGGQGTMVRLQNAQPVWDPATRVLSADVTVQNLIAQALGTDDGITPHPSGVRVFFHGEPSGGVEVLDAETGTFTGSAQPYYRYDGILLPGHTTAPRTWRWGLPAGVESFTFTVYVAAPVAHEAGWVELAPDTVTLAAGGVKPFAARVLDVAGREVEGAAVSWSSSAPAVASVDQQGRVTAKLAGTAVITATSGGRSGSADVAVVASGTPTQIVTVSGHSQSATKSQPLGQPLVARVADAGGNPVEGVTVTFNVHVGGGSVSPTSAVSGADGLVQTAWTLGPVVGGQQVRATAPGLTMGVFNASAVDQGMTRTWVGGDGAGPTAWGNAANWSPAGVPIALDTVVVPSTAVRQPTLSANATVSRLTLQANTLVNVGAFTLQTNLGDLAGTVQGTTGAVSLRTGTVRGAYPSLRIVGNGAGDTVRAVGDVTVGGVLYNAGRFKLGSHRVEVMGDVDAGGSFHMTDAAARLLVRGGASFRGGREFTAGRLEVAGPFSQSSFTSGFAATGTHLTVLNGTVPQTVSFNDPGSSAFQALQITNPTSVTFLNGGRVHGSVTVTGGGEIRGSTGTLNVTGDLTTDGAVDLTSLTVGGVLSVAGAYDVTTTTLAGTTVPALPYHHLVVRTTGAVLPAGLHVAGDLTLGFGVTAPAIASAPGAKVTVAGKLSVIGAAVFMPGGDVDVAGDAAVNGTLVAGARTVDVGGALTVSGRLTMQDAAGRVRVKGAATFSGITPAGGMSAGRLEVGGDFTQQSNSSAFVATGSLRVVLNGAAAQTVRFSGSGASSSRFQELEVANATGVTLATNGFVTSLLAVSPGARLTVASNGASGYTLTVGSAAAGDVTVGAGATLANQGTLSYGGTLTNAGTITGNAPVDRVP